MASSKAVQREALRKEQEVAVPLAWQGGPRAMHKQQNKKKAEMQRQRGKGTPGGGRWGVGGGPVVDFADAALSITPVPLL